MPFYALPGKFPTLVRPEPIGRLAPDGLLQTTGKQFSYLSVGGLLRIFGQQVEVCLAVSPPLLLQLAIENGITHHLGYAFAAIHEDRVLIQESGPVVCFTKIRRLVGDQPYRYPLAVTAQSDYFAGSRMFRYVITAVARTDKLEHLVEIFIPQRFIYLHWDIPGTMIAPIPVNHSKSA